MQTMNDRRVVGLIGVTALATLLATPARADDDVAAFYAGKTIQMMVATASGGGVDLVGRMIARHMPNHIPGKPTIIVQNAPGAGA